MNNKYEDTCYEIEADDQFVAIYADEDSMISLDREGVERLIGELEDALLYMDED